MDANAMKAAAGQAARLLRSLGNEHRLMILCYLLQGEMSVGELGGRLDLSQSALSQHLAVLRRDGLVATRRRSQMIFYRLGGREAPRLIELLHELYCRAPALAAPRDEAASAASVAAAPPAQ